MSNFAELNTKVAFYALVFLWVHVPISAALSFGLSGDGWLVPMIVALLCGAATLIYRLDKAGLQSAMVTSAALAVIIGLFVFLMRGHPWQTDMHMYFFAGLALTAMFIRWQAVATFTAVVAVHHLALNYAMTEAVFPGEADLTRVLFHAGILLFEAIPMIFITFAVYGIMANSAASLAQVENARQMAETMTQESQHQQKRLVEVVDVMGTGLQRLSMGDLTQRIADEKSVEFTGDLAALKDNFNLLADRLEQIFAAVGESTALVSSASNETAAAARDIANKAEAQANTVNQSVHHLAQLNTLFGQTADLASAANVQIQRNRTEVERGGKVLVDAVQAMKKIEDSSKLIRQSVDAIDDIAFQTNLLALNAGVEAARAGDSASGFAVVAQEVRNLALRASTAAADIRQLIQDSESRVNEGSEVVAATAASLRSVISGTQKAATIVETIAERTQSQAENLAELTSGVSGLEMTAQQFAGAAEQTTATSDSLRIQANALASVISSFTNPGQQDASFDGWSKAS